MIWFSVRSVYKILQARWLLFVVVVENMPAINSNKNLRHHGLFYNNKQFNTTKSIVNVVIPHHILFTRMVLWMRVPTRVENVRWVKIYTHRVRRSVKKSDFCCIFRVRDKENFLFSSLFLKKKISPYFSCVCVCLFKTILNQ